MNGLGGGRRTASPVRLTLTESLGGDLDGAWWPHTGALARELPELIEALHPTLGEIVDISLSWSATAGAPILNSMAAGAAAVTGWSDRQQRLMSVVGKLATAMLLVVPHMTTPALGRMVLRRAAGMPIPRTEQDSSVFDTAERVVRAARAQSAAWVLSAQAPAAETPTP